MNERIENEKRKIIAWKQNKQTKKKPEEFNATCV